MPALLIYALLTNFTDDRLQYPAGEPGIQKICDLVLSPSCYPRLFCLVVLISLVLLMFQNLIVLFLQVFL